jgi:NAD(P)-dependent dehydrogenase (short-subunit alcohol dehydrogenase family)
VHVTRAALPHLLEAASGSARRVSDVVNVSPVAGRVAFPQAALCNATRFGVNAATESWRQEYAQRGVRFSVVEPGFVDTELTQHQDHLRAA